MMLSSLRKAIEARRILRRERNMGSEVEALKERISQLLADNDSMRLELASWHTVIRTLTERIEQLEADDAD